ncbi:CamS family sex pheromone protein [Brevibacillus massiliensis]|uniref:CamS family sex pheromone protein n=1 Tax=Brevibacillus massiliensis TaxID=1118054 RepID=UPI0002F462D8|nr:CamS family sex pheromone protein [Brevibacillus massiliensis]
MKRLGSKIFLIGAAISLALTASACSLLPGQKEEAPATPSVSADVKVSENYYTGIVPYQQNQTRGMFSRLSSSRADFGHQEMGLMEIAQQTFSPSQYFFQEGQRISRDQVKKWLSSTSENPEGLNPDKGPNLLVHVLEHDYLDMQQKQLAGIVLGLALSPVYKDASDKEQQYTIDQLRAKGEQMASRIVQKVRADNPQIPMVIVLYQVADRNSTLVPGRFILSGTVNAEESSVSKWQPIDEAYYLFPSAQLENDYSQISLQYDKLMKQLQSFFGEYIGVTGLGRFMSGQLIELTITATAEYDSRTEVLQFTQYAAALIDQLFDKNVHVNLYVRTTNQPLAVYVRPADGEPFMHIYRR